MSESILPSEVLQLIFKNLCGSDILECSKVCRRWEQAVDNLSDKFWKEICANEHREIYELAYGRAKLSWRELYVSLNLWSDVAAANNFIRHLDKNGKKFQLLSNGLIACSYSRGDVDSDYGFDTIVYYDLETLTEDHRENFDFYFMRYEENDHFIVLQVDHNGLEAAYIYVILKSNEKKVVFGSQERPRSWRWTLYGSQIYLLCDYDNIDNYLYRVQIIEQNNDLTLVTDDIKYMGDSLYIQGVTNTNQATNIISKADGRIYSIIDKDMQLLCTVDINNDDELNRAMKKYGFDWQCLGIFDRHTFAGSPVKISYSYGKIVIINNSSKFPQTIDIYHVLHNNPYDDQGKVTYDKATPTISIDLSVLNPNSKHRDLEIRQIGVVETQKGHKVVVSSLNTGIFVVELNHNTTGKISAYKTDNKFYDTLFTKIFRRNMKPRW